MSDRIAELEKTVEELSIRFAQKITALEKAEEEIAFLKKQLYGPKSERPSAEVQYVMGELFYEASQDEASVEDEGEGVT